MQRYYALMVMGLALPFTLAGQIKKQFSVDDHPHCKTVHLRLKANAGTCFIKPSDSPELLSMYSNQDPGAYAHQFVKEIKGTRCDVLIAIEESNKGGFGQTISTQFFGAEKSAHETFWKVYLSQHKPYRLSLNYALGQANIDLSGLSIENFRLLSGSSNVQVGYPTGIENKVSMDTFYVKVELGSVAVNNLSLSRARHVIADVGFGNLTLDLSSKPTISQVVHGSVGAGNLTIILPDETAPVMVKIKDSWLCSVKMLRHLKKTGDGVFTSAAYTPDAPNALVFDLDVSMGNIIFRENKQN